MFSLLSSHFPSRLSLAAIALTSFAAGKDVPAIAADSTAKKPMNILYIMSDDHSYQTLSAYSKRFVETPNIDRIAKDGILFRNSFVSNSISGPSRACMLTGKHSHANGFINNSTTFDGAQQTYPKLLQKVGYSTAVIGKWHLNSTPTGFDHSDILIGQGEYFNAPFILNGKRTATKGYSTNLIGKKGIAWMKEQDAEGKPFCLLLHHKAPHRAWQPDIQDLARFDDVTFPLPDNFYDTYEGRPAAASQQMSIAKHMCIINDNKMADKENEIRSNMYEYYGRRQYDRLSKEDREACEAHYAPIIAKFKEAKLSGKALAEWKYQRYMRDYLGTIVALDRSIGEVLDYLDESGLAENTLVVYTSDQGFYMGEHGWFDKRFMYEESFRTPLLMRLPGGKKGDVEVFVQNIDYAPTILDLAGIATPADMHGESLLPLLRGEKPANWRKSLYYHYYEYPAEHAVKRHYGVRTERYKLIHFYNDIDVWELYDLQQDPSEMNNIYDKPEMREVIVELRAELLKLQKQYDDKAAIELNGDFKSAK